MTESPNVGYAQLDWTTEHHLRAGVILLLLGPPGIGKGTQASALSRLWTIPHISTGDLLRGNVAKRTDLGRAAEEIMGRGELVPDSIIVSMLEERFREEDLRRGFILDGFPRTLDQAQWLTEQFAIRSEHQIIATRLHLDRRDLACRISGRWYCPSCQASFNAYLNPAKTAGLCDRDGTVLVQRPDDREEVFRKRLRVYEVFIAPVVEHYRLRGCFVDVAGNGPIESVTKKIQIAVKRFSSAL